MILDRKYRHGFVPESLYRTVIHIYMGNFQVLICQGIAVYGIAMVLGCNMHLACSQVFNGMVGPPVPKL